MLKQLVDRFIAVPMVGVDVGSAALKVVELAQTDHRLIIRRAAIASLDQGADAADSLKQLLSDAGISATQAALGLASPEVIVKPFQFPPMPKKELASAIQLEAEESILNGHLPNDMAMDWHVLSSKETIRGLLAVVPKKAVAGRLKIAREAGLRPAVVDVEGLALWNAYWTLVGARDPAPKTVFLVNVGAKTTNLVIAKGPDELMLIRDLQFGAEALAAGQESDWVADARDSISYAFSVGGMRTLDAVYVTGGGSGPTLIPLLKAAVSAPLTFWNPLNQLERDPDAPSISDAQGPLLAIAIGLALRQPS